MLCRIGDKVRIRKDLKSNSTMKKLYEGKEAYIVDKKFDYFGEEKYKIDIDNGIWVWRNEDFECNIYDSLKTQINNLEKRNIILGNTINNNQNDIKYLKELLEQYKESNYSNQNNLGESFWEDFKNKRAIIICDVKDALEFLNLADSHGLAFVFYNEPWYKSLKSKSHIKNIAFINNYDNIFKVIGENVGQSFKNQYNELGLDVIEFNPQNNLKIDSFSNKELLDELKLRMEDK